MLSILTEETPSLLYIPQSGKKAPDSKPGFLTRFCEKTGLIVCENIIILKKQILNISF
jgi:hypothetical protein